MAFLYLFVSVLLLRIAPIFSTNELNCTMRDSYTVAENGIDVEYFYDGVISVAYDRDNLAIYNYNFTQFANLLLEEAEINFNGVFSKENRKDVKLELKLQTDIEGIAFLKKYKNKPSPLTKCQLDLKKNIKFKQVLPEAIQEKVVQLAHACILPKLCTELGDAEQDDYVRAKINPHDFAENSVLYKVLGQKYPNLDLPDPKDKNQTNLQGTLNFLSDFWLASLATQLSGEHLGYVELPNLNETISGIPLISAGHFILKDGKIGDLRAITRNKDVIVTNKGLEFAIEAGFQLPNSRIHFNEYSLKIGPLNNNGKIDIDIDCIEFNIRVVMNYNESPCRIQLEHVHSHIGDIKFKLSESSILDKLISKAVTNVVRKFTCNIVEVIETKLRDAISSPLKSFNCEKYRP